MRHVFGGWRAHLGAQQPTLGGVGVKAHQPGIGVGDTRPALAGEIHLAGDRALG